MSACNAASKVNLQKHPPRGSASLVREGGCEVNDGLCRSRLERARVRARDASFFAECFISGSSLILNREFGAEFQRDTCNE